MNHMRVKCLEKVPWKKMLYTPAPPPFMARERLASLAPVGLLVALQEGSCLAKVERRGGPSEMKESRSHVVIPWNNVEAGRECLADHTLLWQDCLVTFVDRYIMRDCHRPFMATRPVERRCPIP